MSTTADKDGGGKNVLDPIDRISEVLFGLIMVLTFTGSLSAAEAGRAEVRAMLIGALGCNLAWGIVDAVMYLMGRLTDRSRGVLTVRAVQQAPTPAAGQKAIADVLPEGVARLLDHDGLERLRQRLLDLPVPPARARLRRDDWLGAGAVFLLVFLSTFPVVIPFLFTTDAPLALRISNAIPVAMLFLTGYGYGRAIGNRPWLMGAVMVLLGSALVGLTMALGG